MADQDLILGKDKRSAISKKVDPPKTITKDDEELRSLLKDLIRTEIIKLFRK